MFRLDCYWWTFNLNVALWQDIGEPSFRSKQMRVVEVQSKSAEPPGFREGMLSLFHPHVPMEVVSYIEKWLKMHFRKVIEMFKPGYCGLCCIKFSGDKFCWKHYTGKGHAGLLQRKSYRFLEQFQVRKYAFSSGTVPCPGRWSSTHWSRNLAAPRSLKSSTISTPTMTLRR